jgi:Trk-type K+ transport system membrane component
MSGRDGVATGARVVRRHPTQSVLYGFISLIMAGAGLLLLPVSHLGDEHPGFVSCVFTATSAATVTGLTVVDASVWSPFGNVVLLVLVQLGGFGIMTLGAVLVIVASRRLGVRRRLLAQTEIGALSSGDIRSLVRTIAIVTVLIESTSALVLATRFWSSGREDLAGALWSGLFHAVMAFNNAGMSLYSDNLSGFTRDPVVLITISLATIELVEMFGEVGQVVLHRHRIRPRVAGPVLGSEAGRGAHMVDAAHPRSMITLVVRRAESLQAERSEHPTTR